MTEEFESGRLAPGYVHENLGFVSTSLNPSVATSFMNSRYPVRMRILAEPGDRAFGFGSFYQHASENEILFGSGSKFEVLRSRYVDAEGFRIPVLEIWVRLG